MNTYPAPFFKYPSRPAMHKWKGKSLSKTLILCFSKIVSMRVFAALSVWSWKVKVIYLHVYSCNKLNSTVHNLHLTFHRHLIHPLFAWSCLDSPIEQLAPQIHTSTCFACTQQIHFSSSMVEVFWTLGEKILYLSNAGVKLGIMFPHIRRSHFKVYNQFN